MANTDFYNTCQRIASNIGVQPYADRNTFNNDALLVLPQLKIKKLTDLVNRGLLRRLNKLFMKRAYTLITVPGQSDYQTDNTCDIEGITYHSVRTIAPSSGVRRLAHINFEEYRNMYPDPTLVPQTQPTMWTEIITPIASGVNRLNTIRLIPTPDIAYTIEYFAKTNAQPLSLDTDVINYPPEYEDVLWTWAQKLIDRDLGVKATMEDYADQALDALRAWATGPIDQRQAVRLGVKITANRRYSGGYYDTPTYTAGW